MKPTLKSQNALTRLEQEWEHAVARAAQQTSSHDPLGAMLTETAGLHIQSGVQAGSAWGNTTSCTCKQSCGGLC